MHRDGPGSRGRPPRHRPAQESPLTSDSPGPAPFPSPSGLLVVRKPAGPSSFAIVRDVREALGGVRTGHCGTLDPAAEGVLLVVVGAATKRQDDLMRQDKVYSGTILLGQKTDTGDLKGRPLPAARPGPLTLEEVRAAARLLEGERLQIPPMFSALKRGGERLYALARKGIVVPREPRPVRIRRFEILGYDPPAVTFRVECSSGTYLRSLAEELGERLNCGAVLSALVRERVGPYGLEDSLTVEEIRRRPREWVLSRMRPV